jgi:hypothetical protein
MNHVQILLSDVLLVSGLPERGVNVINSKNNNHAPTQKCVKQCRSSWKLSSGFLVTFEVYDKRTQISIRSTLHPYIQPWNMHILPLSYWRAKNPPANNETKHRFQNPRKTCWNRLKRRFRNDGTSASASKFEICCYNDFCALVSLVSRLLHSFWGAVGTIVHRILAISALMHQTAIITPLAISPLQCWALKEDIWTFNVRYQFPVTATIRH